MTETTEFLPRIGALVRDARQQSGLTQAQLATTLGTSQSAINRIEKGQQNLTLEMISRIGRALDTYRRAARGPLKSKYLSLSLIHI